MRAIRLEEPEHFIQTEVPEPVSPGADEALVTVNRVGICGTDIAGYLGRMPFYSYPRIPGHELGVEVISVGEGVGNVQAGDRCSVEPYINCQECYPCRGGHSNCCENLEVLGVHRDGGLRPRFIVPARKLHPSGKLGPEALALVETLAIGCHAVDRANPQPDETVLVIGAGPIGLSTLEFIRIAGARALVLDLNSDRLEFCQEKMGVAATVLAKGDGSDVEALRDLTNGALPSVVIDATGNNRSMSNALNYTAFSGRVVFVGITTSEITFGHPLMHRRELTLLASRNALSRDFTRIISLIEEGAIDTEPWITHRTPFNELITAFPSFTQAETGVIKAMVEV